MSYGPNLPDQFRRAGDFVDKILRGVKPGNIPVEQPTKLLKDIAPGLTRVGFLFNPQTTAGGGSYH
jgi:ABC-type uncharacterized transport system substrate-binding protein